MERLPIGRDLEPITAEQIALRALIDELFKRIDKIKSEEPKTP